MTSQARSGPLAGLRVVEMAAIGPVPFAGTMLASMGAEIVRVDIRTSGRDQLRRIIQRDLSRAAVRLKGDRVMLELRELDVRVRVLVLLVALRESRRDLLRRSARNGHLVQPLHQRLVDSVRPARCRVQQHRIARV